MVGRGGGGGSTQLPECTFPALSVSLINPLSLVHSPFLSSYSSDRPDILYIYVYIR